MYNYPRVPIVGQGTVQGSLTKWTNVVKGWQHRWFVLDEAAGLLSYYTSREKMMRGVRRGCVRLKGAIVGIDNEEDGNFTITTDTKTFHFQGRDAHEREIWVQALEDAILRHAPFPHAHHVPPIVVLRRHVPHHLSKGHFEVAENGEENNNLGLFDTRIGQADVLLQLLIEQSGNIKDFDANPGEDVEMRINTITNYYHEMIDAVKLAIVLLQILKSTVDPVYGIGLVSSQLRLTRNATSSSSAILNNLGAFENRPRPDVVEVGSECQEPRSSHLIVASNPTLVVPLDVPETSYSSSDDDDDYFDADDEMHSPAPRTPTPAAQLFSGSRGNSAEPLVASSSTDRRRSTLSSARPPLQSDGTIDYDALYDEDVSENSDGELSMENHGSIITHLLSQVKIGMDLTKVVLPTFILETRSLLEMYADYFAHPDIFVSIADGKTPRERMIRVVKWYLSAYHAGRKGGIAKKPYNPILGEIFQCYWNVPNIENGKEAVSDGPVPWCTTQQLSFVAEQVSHHPPVSAFYAEHVSKRITFDAFVYTRSKFLGLSVGVHNVGNGKVRLIDLNEEYVVTFPSGYGRSILTVPWIELGGSVTIECAQTGYRADVEFHIKPFYGGKKHRITAEVYAPSEKKPFLSVAGEWNGYMEAKYHETGKVEPFVDVTTLPIEKKCVRSVSQQTENESRFVWRNVTAGLKLNDIDRATTAKCEIEQRQRDLARIRKEQDQLWESQLFASANGGWAFKQPLEKRLENVQQHQDHL